MRRSNYRRKQVKMVVVRGGLRRARNTVASAASPVIMRVRVRKLNLRLEKMIPNSLN